MIDSSPATSEVWKRAEFVERYLNFHTAIPLVQEQIGVMLTQLGIRSVTIRSYIGHGCVRSASSRWIFFRIYELAIFAGKRPNRYS